MTNKADLEGDEDSFTVAKISRLAKIFRSDMRVYTAFLEGILDSVEQSNIAMSTALCEEDGREQEVASREEVARPPSSQSDVRSCPASTAGGGGAASSGDTEAAGSAAGGDAEVSEEPAGHGGEDQEGSSKATVTQYLPVTSASSQTSHSATCGNEADCDPETTPAASTNTDSSNCNGEGNGYGNAISNGQVGMQSTESQTDESWNAWDCVGVDTTDDFSLRVVLSALREEQYRLQLLLQHHVERMESLRLPRLHITSQMDPSAASRLLRLQLQQVLRTVEWELHWALHSVSVRGLSVDLLTHCVLSHQPVPPRHYLPAPRSTYRHLLDRLAEAAGQPGAPPPTLNTTYQQLLAEAQAVEGAPARPPTMQAAMRRALALMVERSSWQFYE